MLEVIRYFFSLGFLGFGGPFASIATMQRDLVEKRKWISENEFSQAFAMIKAMPGPVASQMCMYLSIRRAGRWGGIAGGISFLVPPFLLMLLLAVGAKALSTFSFMPSIFLGFQAAAFALIILSFRSLAKPYKKDPLYWTLCICVAAISWVLPIPEPILIIGAGIVALLFVRVQLNGKNHELGTLFWICFKAGAFVFGSGLAIVPLLEEDFVTRLHWVTHAQFLDALAFGQITPGPVVISATYLGFLTHGFAGACVATLAIFLPAAVHMLTWFPAFLARYGDRPAFHTFGRGAIAAVSGVMLVFCAHVVLGWAPSTIGIAVLCMLALLFGNWPAWIIVPFGGIISFLLASFWH